MIGGRLGERAVREQLVLHLQTGASRKMACAATRVNYEHFLRVLARGRRGDDAESAAFYAEVASAEALLGSLALATMHSSIGDPKWAAWYLERKFPEDFGRSVHDVRVGNSKASDTELLEVILQHVEEALIRTGRSELVQAVRDALLEDAGVGAAGAVDDDEK